MGGAAAVPAASTGATQAAMRSRVQWWSSLRCRIMEPRASRFLQPSGHVRSVFQAIEQAIQPEWPHARGLEGQPVHALVGRTERARSPPPLEVVPEGLIRTMRRPLQDRLGQLRFVVPDLGARGIPRRPARTRPRHDHLHVHGGGCALPSLSSTLAFPKATRKVKVEPTLLAGPRAPARVAARTMTPPRKAGRRAPPSPSTAARPRRPRTGCRRRAWPAGSGVARGSARR